MFESRRGYNWNFKFQSSNIKNSNSSKTAVVTGGARRLGRYISYYLAEAGYNLAVMYNSSSPEELSKTSEKLKSFGVKFGFYQCDFMDMKKILSTIDKIGKDFEKIDLLVNNAGIIQKIDFMDITEEVIDRFLDVNLKAPMFIAQHSVRYLNEATEPLIINIASLGGLQNWVNYIPYGISKAGIIKLTYLLAKRLAPKIRVNAIAPGTIEIKDEEAGTPEKTPVNKIPLARYGTPENIIEAVKYLINAKYVTGQIIAVDGGRLVT